VQASARTSGTGLSKHIACCPEADEFHELNEYLSAKAFKSCYSLPNFSCESLHVCFNVQHCFKSRLVSDFQVQTINHMQLLAGKNQCLNFHPLSIIQVIANDVLIMMGSLNSSV
jgi:hypothetical protein